MNKIKLFSMFATVLMTCGQVLAADGGASDGAEGGKDEVFSGVYKDHQVIPNTMATLCKTSAEYMVADPTKLKSCVDKLAIKRNSSDAETSREGLKDLNIIKADQLQEMIALATAKSAAVAEYYANTAKETSDANANAKTVNDVDGAAINTNALSTSMINALTELYTEQLKYLAISNIENIDKSTLEEVASSQNLADASGNKDAKEPAQVDQNASTAPVAEVNTSTATVVETEPAKAWHWKGDGVCELCVKKDGDNVECRQEPCPDGTYPDPNDANVNHVCSAGICEKVDLAQ
jgi:hypothetical protein